MTEIILIVLSSLLCASLLLMTIAIRGWHNANIRNRNIIDKWGQTIENNGALIAQNQRLIRMLRGEEPVDQSRLRIDFSNN